MTLGSSGGSPKTLQRINYTFGSTSVYTCPSDTMAVIYPILLVSSGGFPNFNTNSVQLGVRTQNPVGGGNLDLMFKFLNVGATFPGNSLYIGPAELADLDTGSPDSYLVSFSRFETVVNTNANTSSGGQVGSKVLGSGIILYPGDILLCISSGAGDKLQYSLREFATGS